MQLLADNIVDHGIDQPHPSAESIEDGRLAHLGGRGDLLERRREPLLSEHLDSRMQDPVDVPAGIRAESGCITGVGHDAASFGVRDQLDSHSQVSAGWHQQKVDHVSQLQLMGADVIAEHHVGRCPHETDVR